MKTKIMLSKIVLLLLFSIQSNAQNQLFAVHQDVVHPSMNALYEKTVLEMVDAHKKFEIKNTNWKTIRMNNGNYIFVEPVASMAQLDQNPSEVLVEKMGKSATAEYRANLNKCYDEHGDFMVTYLDNLSYKAPTQTTSEPENYLKFHYLYVTPTNSKALADQIKVIKSLYEKAKSTESFNVYHSTFGVIGEYYVVVISAKDEESYMKTSNDTEAKLGKEGQDAMIAMMTLVDRYDPQAGYMIEKLSYTAPK